MTDRDSLGDRMKLYEQAARTLLPRRLPVIIRVDGKAFHTLTRGCEKPFDHRLGNAMANTAAIMCGEIQGAQLAYTQSDEISVLVNSYKRHNSSAWFDNQVQKMVSVAAGIASAHFTMTYGKLAVFDARVFVMPESDVCNYFVWRQQDAVRNSIQALAQSLYSHKELHQKTQPMLQEMCFAKGHNWNDLPVRWKRGVCVTRVAVETDTGTRSHWAADWETPTFTQQRSYIEQHLAVEPEA